LTTLDPQRSVQAALYLLAESTDFAQSPESIACFEVAGEPARTLNTGEAFFEPANVKILHFDNASQTEPMTFTAVYLLGQDERELIRMLK